MWIINELKRSRSLSTIQTKNIPTIAPSPNPHKEKYARLPNKEHPIKENEEK